VRDSCGQSIGAVVGLWHFFELEYDSDHFLNLFFVGFAVAG
jgi:hypothetical protein